MTDITPRKPNEDEVCCRCGIPKRIGCHHQNTDEEEKPEQTEEEKEFEEQHIKEIQNNLPTTKDLLIDMVEKIDFALEFPNWLVAIICTKEKEAHAQVLASHVDGLPGRDWLFENLGRALFENYGERADDMIARIQDGSDRVKTEVVDAGVTE